MPPKITMLDAFASGHGCDFDEPMRLWASAQYFVGPSMMMVLVARRSVT
jgi:hypothetical protein